MSTSECCREKWFSVFLSAVFEDRQRKMSRSPMCHKIEIFYERNFEDIGRKDNFPFWKVPGMLTSKRCRWVSFACFWVRFSGIDGGTCQETRCAMKWKFYAWVPQIAFHFLNCLQNYAQGAYRKNYSKGGQDHWKCQLKVWLIPINSFLSCFFP